jgi:hypothetical protein
MRRHAVVVAVAAGLVAAPARAQMGVPSQRGGQPGQSTPTQSGPTQNKTVGPRAGQRGGDDDEGPSPASLPRGGGEPLAAPPADPLAIPPEVKDQIGTDADVTPPPPVGDKRRTWFPYFEERRGDSRFRFLPPLYLESTRGLPTTPPVYGEPTQEDRQSLYGMLFYQRRSPKLDMDVLFPLAWRVRDGVNRVWALGPIAHREAPGEHDNWLAPLVMEGERKDGGYFHSPLLLTTSHWSKDKAFWLTGLYFRDRSGSDVDWGVAPFYFHGDNGNIDGARKTYSLIPPLLYFHKETEIDESKTTVVGPVILRSDPKRSITDVAPFFFHIEGKPETGGIRESHTTVFPLFHYGWKDDETHASLLVVPGYLHRRFKGTDTTLTPLISTSTTRNGSTSLLAVGPVLPLVWNYHDRDIDQHTWATLPFFYHSSSPQGLDWLTPVFGRFENYGVSRTYWTFPTIVVSLDTHGWESDVYPFAFVGRSETPTERKSHAVLAPIFWDFASDKGRATVVAPLYWRFADSTDDSVTQIAGNLIYLQKRVAGGIDWQFHVAPFVSYGEVPHGHWWNFLFGLAGYSHDTNGEEHVRIFWIPIKTGDADPVQKAAMARGKDPAYHGARF